MFGLCLVLFLAGIQKIPPSLYEAARVDGAGRVREFFAVTLPGLRGELAVALTLTTIMALRTFDLIYVSTQRRSRARRPPCRPCSSTRTRSPTAGSGSPRRSRSC